MSQFEQSIKALKQKNTSLKEMQLNAATEYRDLYFYLSQNMEVFKSSLYRQLFWTKILQKYQVSRGSKQKSLAKQTNKNH